MTDQLAMLRRFRADVSDANNEARRTARAALAHAIATERAATDTPALRPARNARARRRWVLVRATAVAVIALVAVTVAALLRSGSPSAPQSAVAATLDRLALVAAQSPSNVPRAGQYFYVDSVWGGTMNIWPYVTNVDRPAPAGSPYLRVFVRVHWETQEWFGANGSYRQRDTYSKPAFTSPQDVARWKAVGSPAIPKQASTYMVDGRGCAPPQPVQGLSTNPAVLRAQVVGHRTANGEPASVRGFETIAQLLRDSEASPALRSALFKVAATLGGGVRIIGSVRNHAGQKGVGIRLRQQILIIDPETSELIGDDTLPVHGSLGGWEIFPHRGIVNSVPNEHPTSTARLVKGYGCTSLPANKIPKH